MLIAAVIRQENQILLEQIANIDSQAVWELPNCEVYNADDPIYYLVEKCKTFNVTIEVTDIFFKGELDNQQFVVYNTELLSYSHVNNSARWVDANEIKKISVSKQYMKVVNKLVHEYDIINSINSEIEQIIVEVSNELGVKVEPITSYNSFRVFVHNDYGGYCPFIFSIDFTFDSENDINFIHSWHITRMYAEGDKTDLYVLFANLMSLFLKCIFQKSVYVDYLSLFDPIEINAATIIFNEVYKNLNVKKLKEAIKQIYETYIFCMMLFENFIGSFSLIPDDESFISKYIEYLDDNESYNSFSREEHQYYYNYSKGISVLLITNGVYKKHTFQEAHKWDFVDGIDGKILHQVDMEEESFNYVSYEDWDRILKVIKDMNIEEYTIVCQVNHLYLLEQNSIWIFEGDFSEYWVTIEKEKILDRQSLENKVCVN